MTYYIVSASVIATDTGLYIPVDPDNSDYQAYLAWVAAGNTPTSNPFVPPASPGGDIFAFADVCADSTNPSSGSRIFNETGTGFYSGYFVYNNGDYLGLREPTGTGKVVLATSPTIANPILSGTLTAGGGAGTSGQVLASTGTGVQWSSTSTVPILADGRLTLVSNTPVVQPNASSATTLYYTPYLGNRITLYSGSLWEIVTFSQLSIAVPSTSNTNYDVYVYNNSGTATLELTAWTNDTTRATALTTQDGVLVKTGATTRRYIGTVRTNPTSGQMSDEPSQRHVWNMYNRVAAHFYAGTTGTYNYTTATWRAAGNDTTLGLSRVQWVCGQNTHIQLINYSMAYNGSSLYVTAGIGIDQTAGNDAQIRGGGITASNQPSPMTAFYDAIVTPGYHYGQRVEISGATGTTTWYSAVSNNQLGMRGTIFC